MAVTITYIAKEIWISVALVSRLLRDGPTLKIADRTKRKIVDATDRLERGLKPGIDISIIGFDDIETQLLKSEKPELTTVDNPFKLVGRRTGYLLLDQILHECNDIIHEHVPCDLIIRKSTGPCPI